MDERKRPEGAVDDQDSVGVLNWIGVAIAILLLLFLIWWMPARVAPGFIIPRITGSAASLPARLPVLWVRSWPWQTSPPPAEVTFHLASGRRVTLSTAATGTKVGWLSGRAIPIALTLSSPPAMKPNRIAAITISWPGGSASADESALWIAAKPNGTIRGARVVWATALSPKSRVGVLLSTSRHPDVIGITSPNPTVSPWTGARCIAVPGGDKATVQAALLEGKLPSAPRSCASVGFGDAVVIVPHLAQGYTFTLWQPVLQEVVNTHIRTYIAGPVELGSVRPMTAGNWWRFAASTLRPGL